MNNVQGLLGIAGGLAALFLFAWGIVYIIYRSERSTKRVDHQSPITQPPDSPANTKMASPQAEHIRKKIPSMRQEESRVQGRENLPPRQVQKQKRPPENRP